MKTLGLILLSALLVAGAVAWAVDAQTRPATAPEQAIGPTTAPSDQADVPVRFAAVHVYVDAGDKPLAAYQFELTATAGDVKLVGLEGGEHPAFKPAPYYDPDALLRNKVVVAAFSTAADLPRGRTRVATLMVQITGQAEPAYAAKLQTAASADGQAIPAQVIVMPQSTPPDATEARPEGVKP